VQDEVRTGGLSLEDILAETYGLGKLFPVDYYRLRRELCDRRTGWLRLQRAAAIWPV
jgi:hypothetical protein